MTSRFIGPLAATSHELTGPVRTETGAIGSRPACRLDHESKVSMLREPRKLSAAGLETPRDADNENTGRGPGVAHKIANLMWN